MAWVRWTCPPAVLLAFLLAPAVPAARGGDEQAPEEGEVVATRREVPRLAAPAPHEREGAVVAIELSPYAGYAGLVAANGGLDPTESSVFFQRHGFQVRLTLTEGDSWSALNSGKIAASAATVDVLAVYGRQVQVVVPALIGFSRGAYGIVVTTDVKRVNDLKGKVVASVQFTGADFLLRYLTQEAGIPVRMLDGLSQRPDADKVNVVFCADGLAAGDLFRKDVLAGGGRLAGCVTRAPKVAEVAEGSEGKAHVLLTNRNILVVADILVVNRGFADANPDVVKGLVEGLLVGNAMVREDRETHLPVIAKAFGWKPEVAREELSKVHLANFPENQAFFAGTIDSAGSWEGIYASAEGSYGSELIPSPTPPEGFFQGTHLDAIAQAGTFHDQRASIQPERSKGSAGPGRSGDLPDLSKDIRFLFRPNSVELDVEDVENTRRLESIRRLLQVSPGSTVLLRGHVDDAHVEHFRRQGGDAYVRKMSLKAMQLSNERARTIARLLKERHGVDESRIQTVGRGWQEPLGTDSARNRRVEVHWFTLE